MSHRQGLSKLEILIPLGICGLVLALLIPAVQQSREAARRTQSKNNLKQWMLAIENYDSTYNLLPLGGSVDRDRVGHHGWPTRLIPYLAQTTLFNEFDFDQPWDTPRNEYLCLDPIWINLNPAIPSLTTTPEGYSLMHYQANPNLMHRNHCAGFDDMTDGRGETWVLGEASGEFLPWAYPFNWRALGSRLNDRDSGFGRLDQFVTYFGMADGSVRALNKDVDTSILRKWSDSPPMASVEQVTVPPRPAAYRYSGNTREFSIRQGGDYWPTVFVNRRLGTRDVEIRVSGKWTGSEISRPSRDLVTDLTVNQTPATTSLAGPIVLDEAMMAVVGRLSSVHTLQVDRIEVTPVVLERLRTINGLRSLQASRFENDQRKALQQSLPHVEVKPHSRDFGFREEK